MSDQPEELDIHQLNDLRRRIVSGDNWTREELRNALSTIRIDKQRKSSNAQSNGKGAKQTKPKAPSLDDLL